jgi:hypothetical protein
MRVRDAAFIWLAHRASGLLGVRHGRRVAPAILRSRVCGYFVKIYKSIGCCTPARRMRSGPLHANARQQIAPVLLSRGADVNPILLALRQEAGPIAPAHSAQNLFARQFERCGIDGRHTH